MVLRVGDPGQDRSAVWSSFLVFRVTVSQLSYSQTSPGDVSLTNRAPLRLRYE